MKKQDFFSLILGVIGGIFFTLGMCMCLLPEWNAFKSGCIMGTVGLIVLLAAMLIRRKMSGKSAVHIGKKAAGIIALSVGGAVILGVGMCLCMVWNHMILGIAVGLIGILMLLGLIPLCMGIK